MDPKSTDLKCNKCNKDKAPSQFYKYNKYSCKSCLQDQCKQNKLERRSPTVALADCIKCRENKPPSEFEISEKTKLLKDICKICRGIEPVYTPEEYQMMVNWLNSFNTIKNKDPKTIKLLKDIFSTM